MSRNVSVVNVAEELGCRIKKYGILAYILNENFYHLTPRLIRKTWAALLPNAAAVRISA